jgi:hypothetical protein
VLSEHPDAHDFLPLEASCLGHRLLLDSLSGKPPVPASRLLSSLASDDAAVLTSEVFSKAPPDFDAKVPVAVVNGDVLLSSAPAGCITREVSLLSLAARFGACSCVRFLLSNGSRVGQSEAESAMFGGNSEVIRQLVDRLPAVDEIALLESALKGRKALVARWLLQNRAVSLSESDEQHLFAIACDRCDRERVLRASFSRWSSGQGSSSGVF